MFDAIRKFFHDDSRATAIEYALIASLIALFIITTVQTVGTKGSPMFGEIGNPLH
jgi:pilus assembly protein Flp/PilA